MPIRVHRNRPDCNSSRADSGQRDRQEANIPLCLCRRESGSVLFLVGALTGGLAWLHTVTPSTRIVFFGIFLLLAFYPQFMLVSCCHTLLGAIREMEKRVEESNHPA
jgi:hypothetical protein